MQGLQSIADDLKSKNIQVLAISADSVEDLDKLAKAKGYTFPLLSDPELVAIDAVGLRHANGNPIKKSDIARPAMFLLDKNRKIVWKEYPDNWRKRPTAEKILKNVELGFAGSGY